MHDRHEIEHLYLSRGKVDPETGVRMDRLRVLMPKWRSDPISIPHVRVLDALPKVWRWRMAAEPPEITVRDRLREARLIRELNVPGRGRLGREAEELALEWRRGPKNPKNLVCVSFCSKAAFLTESAAVIMTRILRHIVLIGRATRSHAYRDDASLPSVLLCHILTYPYITYLPG